jgi:hypothetical protein
VFGDKGGDVLAIDSYDMWRLSLCKRAIKQMGNLDQFYTQYWNASCNNIGYWSEFIKANEDNAQIMALVFAIHIPWQIWIIPARIWTTPRLIKWMQMQMTDNKAVVFQLLVDYLLDIRNYLFMKSQSATATVADANTDNDNEAVTQYEWIQQLQLFDTTILRHLFQQLCELCQLTLVEQSTFFTNCVSLFNQFVARFPELDYIFYDIEYLLKSQSKQFVMKLENEGLLDLSQLFIKSRTFDSVHEWYARCYQPLQPTDDESEYQSQSQLVNYLFQQHKQK